MPESHICGEDGARSPKVDTDPECRDLPHRSTWLAAADLQGLLPARPSPEAGTRGEGGRGCWLVSPRGADSISKPQLVFSCLVGLGAGVEAPF